MSAASPGLAAGLADAQHLIGLRHLAQVLDGDHGPLTGMPGGFVSRRRGRGLEADDIRAYQPGDDIRHIDRNATARSGEPHIRRFRDERDRTHLLICDLRPSMLWGTSRTLRSVAAAEALAIAGWRAVAAGARAGLYAFGAGEPLYVPAQARQRGMIAVVGGLAAAQRAALARALDGPETDPPLAPALEAAARWLPRGGTAVLASGLDTPGSGLPGIAAAIARRAEFQLLLVCDRFELDPPAGTYPYRVPGESARLAVLDRRATADAPRDRLAAFSGLGVRVAVIDAGAEPETAAASAGRPHDRRW